MSSLSTYARSVTTVYFNDDTPQKLPGVEVDLITADETDLKNFVRTRTRDAREEMAIMNL